MAVRNRVARTRIVNVRPKAGNVVVFQNPRAERTRLFCDAITRHGRSIADGWKDDLAGYYIVAWDSAGRWTSASRVDRSVMSEGLAIEFVRSCLLRRQIEEDTLERLGYDPEAV